MDQNEKFDGVFMGAVQQAAGIENFFEALMGFFRRKTDLFTKEDTSKQMINQIMDKHIRLFKEDKQKQAAIAKKRAEQEAAKKAEAAKKVAKPEPVPEADSGVCEVTEEEAR